MTEKSTKCNILNSAEALFYRKGYLATTTRDIASAAHINISMINYHFRSKEELYISILKKVKPILGNIYKAVNNDNSIKTFIATCISESFKNFRIINIFMNEQFQSSSPEIKMMVDELERQHFEYFEKLLTQNDKGIYLSSNSQVEMLYYSIFGLIKEILRTHCFKDDLDEKKIIGNLQNFINDKILVVE